jgi:hypothetical protein
VRLRVKSVVEIIILFCLSVLPLVLLGSSNPGAWFQSPISPVMSPVAPVVVVEGPSGALTQPERATPLWATFPVARASFWASPLPWIVVGLGFFSTLAWGVSRVLRYLSSDDT